MCIYVPQSQAAFFFSSTFFIACAKSIARTNTTAGGRRLYCVYIHNIYREREKWMKMISDAAAGAGVAADGLSLPIRN